MSFGAHIIFETYSDINGKVMVTEDGSGRKLLVNGFTQSRTLDEFGQSHGYWDLFYDLPIGLADPKTVLILGLGAGTVGVIWTKLFPDLKITFIEIDPVIAEVAQKYFVLPKNSEIVVVNAREFVQNTEEKFDLICVDVFRGGDFDLKCESDEFLTSLAKITSLKGVVMFNRIYSFNETEKKIDFVNRVKKYFPKVSFQSPNGQNLSFNVIITGQK